MTRARLSKAPKPEACTSSSLAESTAKSRVFWSGTVTRRAIWPENLFQRMKAFRRVATRFDMLDITFLGFVHIADIMKWLR